MPSIAHASEEFRRYVTWEVRPPTAEYYFVGTAPTLNSQDAATSYALNDESPEDEVLVVGVTLAPFTLSRDATVSIQARVRGGPGGPYAFQVFVTDLYGSGASYNGTLDVVDDEWGTFTVPVPFDDVSELVGDAAAGQITVATFGAVGVTATGYDVSWLDLSTGGPIPLRWRQRDDGLSGGPKQWRGVSSQQVGRQHRGYL